MRGIFTVPHMHRNHPCLIILVQNILHICMLPFSIIRESCQQWGRNLTTIFVFVSLSIHVDTDLNPEHYFSPSHLGSISGSNGTTKPSRTFPICHWPFENDPVQRIPNDKIATAKKFSRTCDLNQMHQLFVFYLYHKNTFTEDISSAKCWFHEILHYTKT